MAPSPFPSPPLAARPAWAHSFGGSDRYTGSTVVKQVGAGSSSVLRPSPPTLDVFLLRRNLEADPASHSSRLSIKSAVVRRRERVLCFVRKEANVLLALLFPSPASLLGSSGFRAGWWEDPRWLPLHPGPTVATDVPLRNTGQQSRALFRGKWRGRHSSWWACQHPESGKG
ncbi:hypothetical protein mRhiFer1_008924 [Rhinolophus ferrumequinum]|uniref:Uncharacterized protein n=1 Tax=Rhinolophus ferrumequinum TaxID=59479 RepID=A0A7J7TDQ3_RHIFE|nr:hypothetical protein mRhiFer1_008924 [Rhinolophus ferrumequinum]